MHHNTIFASWGGHSSLWIGFGVSEWSTKLKSSRQETYERGKLDPNREPHPTSGLLGTQPPSMRSQKTRAM